MTSAWVTFEDFEDANTASPKKSADYERGYEAGLRAANQTSEINLAEAIGAISVTLADLKFGYVEAQTLLLQRIRPLVEQISETIIPEIGRQSFGTHLREILETQFHDLTNQPINIAVQPSVLDVLSAALGPNDAFVFSADPTLSDTQVVLKNQKTQLMIDLPSLILALQKALSGLEPLDRIQSNG